MAAGVKEIIEDSSGNAGGAIAAYSSAANIDCTIYCPDKASGAKLSFIRSCGAKLMRIEGARERAAERALEKAEEMVYGSHVWNPWFMTGVRSIAYEIAQQSDILPDEIIMPLGNGALLLGIYQGFKDLIEARVIDRVPALIGVQADEVAPIYQAWTGGTGTHKGSTIAEGIANAQPPRANEIIEAIRDSRGQIISVSEEEIKNSWQEALSRGMLIEPTSAVVLAAEMKIAPQKNRLHMLTGSLLNLSTVPLIFNVGHLHHLIHNFLLCHSAPKRLTVSHLRAKGYQRIGRYPFIRMQIRKPCLNLFSQQKHRVSDKITHLNEVSQCQISDSIGIRLSQTLVFR
jgi:threonine synthase